MLFRFSSSFLVLTTLHTWLAANLASAAETRGSVDFSREILPILSDNCYQCHGPDEKARKAKLRLDTKEGALRARDGKAIIIPARSSESELIRRITSTDPEELMPPPDSHRKLTTKQIESLRRWVDEGATWSQHWAFVSPRRPALPKTTLRGWTRNGIDHFILARLEKEGLQPSLEARKETIVRRLSLDLTGLPPTPAEADAFLNDRSSEAYERLVDRLLRSRRYGERMATDWLDLARYADTHGFQMDRYRPMWAWRDWVIKAFNDNLPFDQFAAWQLAGDLLPNATKDQRLATAFNRLHLQNEEGGIVEEEYRVAYVVDRVNTMGTAFLGLTLECSRCHDHKFDPITQRDFYSLFAFFQNIDESGQTSYFTDSMPVPTLLLSDEATDAKLRDARHKIAEKERQLPALREQARGVFTGWLEEKTKARASASAGDSATPALPGLVASFSFDAIESNKVVNAADSAKPGNAVEGPNLAPGKFGQAAELNGENGFTFPGLGHFTRADPFSLSLWLLTPSHAPRFVVAHHSRAPIDAGSRGYELLLEDGRVAVGLHHMWPRNALKVVSRDRIPTNEWVHITATYDGSSRAAGVRVYVDGRSVPVEVIRDGLFKDISHGGNEPDLAIGFRFRDSGFKGGRVDEFRVFKRALSALEAAHLAGQADFSDAWNTNPSALTPAQREGLLDYYVANLFLPSLKFFEELHGLRQLENNLVNPIPEAMVMEEMAQPRPAYILKRGAYDAPGERVAAGTPSALPPFPADQPRNRLGLARWLLDANHPLTARVAVNRIWQMMFGQGLVDTSDNFGLQGAFPTHPELLDWLACEFVGMGWDMKRLIKLIAMSATYRQSSRAAAELLARDPSNQLLARAPARRLTAEMLRDQALAVSGLLVEKIGGPSVKPYQPEGLWEEIAMGRPRYDQGKGDDLHRRSLYTFWKRTVPHPAMITFDAAERNVCVVRRQNTSTPLQALALLNDTQITEAARHVSQRMLKEGGATREDQIAWAFRTVTGRRASARELVILIRLFDEQRSLFAADQQTAAKLLVVGEATNDPALSLVDLAAGTVLAKAILNHDEAVMRR